MCLVQWVQGKGDVVDQGIRLCGLVMLLVAWFYSGWLYAGAYKWVDEGGGYPLYRSATIE